MPDRRSLLALLIWLGAVPVLADVVPPDDAGAWLAERDRVLAEFGAELPRQPAAEPPNLAEPGPADIAEPQVVGSDVRLALTQMALAAGSAGQAVIAGAQEPGGPGAIYLRAGRASLAGLYEATRGTPLEPVLRREGEAYVASRPIVVVQGAALDLGPGDVLELDREAGAFLLSFGHLSVAGATVRADAPPPGEEDGFRPFVASLGTGTLDVSHGVFVGLGSNLAPVASGLAVSSGSLFAGSDTAVIRDSRFIDVHGLSLLDSNGADVLGNRFDRPRGIAVWADGSDRVEIRDNLVIEPGGAFAARIDGPAADIRFIDNVLVRGDHAGIRIAGEAQAVDLRGNVVEGFAGRGVVVEEGASCLRLSGNLLRGNGGDGFSARDFGDAVIAGNAVLGNGGAGVSLARSRAETGLLVSGNLIAGNRSGVRTASIGSLVLAANDLAGQLPRHLAGDLTQHTPLLLRESRGGARPTLAFEALRGAVAEPLGAEAAETAWNDCREGAGS